MLEVMATKTEFLYKCPIYQAINITQFRCCTKPKSITSLNSLFIFINASPILPAKFQSTFSNMNIGSL